MEQDVKTVLSVAWFLLVASGLILVALSGLVLLLYRMLARRIEGRIAELAEKVNESLDAGVKILEVRKFCDVTHAEYQRMLNQAHRDGDRQRQDSMRRLIEGLGTLKARVVDRTSQLLQDDDGASQRKRRRPRRGRRTPRPGPGGSGDRPSGTPEA